MDGQGGDSRRRERSGIVTPAGSAVSVDRSAGVFGQASGLFAPQLAQARIAPTVEAEAYHQDYAEKNPLRYKFYRFNCGRDARLRELWGEEAGRLPEDTG